MSEKLLVGIICCSVGLTACSHDQVERWASSEQGLTQAQPSGPEDDAVVKLDSQSASGALWACSGTLVAPNLVLTARHCITNFVSGFWTCDADGNLISSGAGQMGQLDTPSNISIRSGPGPVTTKVAKGQAIVTPQVSTICLNDIAFVVLDTQLTNLPIKPIRL